MAKVMYPKYYEKYVYDLAHEMSFVCIIHVYQNKSHFNDKIEKILTFM